MKILLLFPPQWEPGQPPLCLPSLSAVLRRTGFKVILRDINIEAYEEFLTSDILRHFFQKAVDRLVVLKKEEGLSECESDEYSSLSEILLNGDNIVSNIEKAKRILKDPKDFYNFQLNSWSREILNRALELISLAYYPEEFSLAHYTSPFSADSSQGILNAIKGDNKSVFYNFFKLKVVPTVIKVDPDLIGISVISETQILPAFLLARLLKEALKDTHITMGGSIISQWWEVIETAPELFSIIDSFIAFEGESALLKLAETIRGNGSLDSIANLVYKDKEIIVKNCVTNELLDFLPTPDFDGLPLNSYLSPHLVIPLMTGRGCYWSKCAFCTHPHTAGHSDKYCCYRRIDLIINDIKTLKEKYNSPFFFLVDEAIPPNRLRKLTDQLLQQNIQIEWICYTKFEESLTDEFCLSLARAGCKKIFFGAESGSQRILDLIEKGDKLPIRERVIKNLFNAGIAVHLFFIVGFPTETKTDISATRDWILNNLEYIDRFGFTFDIFPLQLERTSRMFKNPNAYSIKHIYHSSENNLQFTFAFDGFLGNATKISEDLLQKIKGHLNDACSLIALDFIQDSSHLLFLSCYSRGVLHSSSDSYTSQLPGE